MRIGIVTTWFERGAAYVSRAYQQALTPEHQVFIYARSGEKYARNDPTWDAEYVTWGRVISGEMMTYVDWDDFYLWVSRNHLECIIFNEQISWEIIIHSRRTLVIPLGAYIDYYTQQTVPFFRLYDFLLCNTHRHYRVFQDHPRAFYIPWGTNLETFSPKLLEHTKDELVIFHSCGLNPIRKGTNLLLQAFQSVQGPVRLIIHSQGLLQDFPEVASLVKADPRVEIIEAEVGAPGLYHLGDVYAYPSILEGIGLTIAEALACGLPVITTDEAPMNEFVVAGKNGILVPIESQRTRPDGYYWPESYPSIHGITSAIQSYVDRQNEIKNHQQAARLYAEEHLNWKTNSRDLPALINQVTRMSSSSDMELIKTVEAYERSLYPYPPWTIPLMHLARKYGARPLKHTFDRVILGKKHKPMEKHETRG